MDNPYITKDIYLTAFLLIHGFPLRYLTTEDRVVFFHFDSTEELEEIILKYFSRNTTVEPTRFLDEIKQLRHLVQDTLRQIKAD